jgi:hypothetical protein
VDSDNAAGWTVRDSKPVRGKRFFSYRKRSKSSPLFRAYEGSFPEAKQSGREVKHPPLPSAPRLKMSGVIPLLPPYMPSWRGQGQLYLGAERFFENAVKVLSVKLHVTTFNPYCSQLILKSYGKSVSLSLYKEKAPQLIMIKYHVIQVNGFVKVSRPVCM